MARLLCIKSHSTKLVIKGLYYETTSEKTNTCCGLKIVTVGIKPVYLVSRCRCGVSYLTSAEYEFAKDLFTEVEEIPAAEENMMEITYYLN